ncbi:hypothetical protein VYU27_008282, partial [Nannochloropsis oceanica]
SGPATNAPTGAQQWMVCVYLPMYFLGLPGQAVTFSTAASEPFASNTAPTPPTAVHIKGKNNK